MKQKTESEKMLDNHTNLDTELSAPICNLDVEEWLESLTDNSSDSNSNYQFKKYCHDALDSETLNSESQKSNLSQSIEFCNSLEDLVKTFDHNVKKCLSNYKDIDVGQLAPVQVRSQEQLMNESQMWYTLTGNFGNLYPIPSENYDSKYLYKKYHKSSLDIKNEKKVKLIKSSYSDTDEFEEFDNEYDEFYSETDYLSANKSDDDRNSNFSFSQEIDFECDNENQLDAEGSSCSENGDEDDELLRDQLDMHSMILAKNIYNENGEMDEHPYITAEEVLNEIETMMTLQDEYYGEMTPDSGCFSTSNINMNLLGPEYSDKSDLPIDMKGSYLTYIKTFAMYDSSKGNLTSDNSDNGVSELSEDNTTSLQRPFKTKNDLANLNIFELNDLIDQIETSTKILSDELVTELEMSDELEFEKETKNTFISLLMSIQEKRRLLNEDRLSISQYSTRSYNTALKKKHRRSMISLDSNNLTHLTTIIPYNNEVEYTVTHLQILNKLLKAIDDDSYQVPELLTNYILKVICPT